MQMLEGLVTCCLSRSLEGLVTCCNVRVVYRLAELRSILPNVPVMALSALLSSQVLEGP